MKEWTVTPHADVWLLCYYGRPVAEGELNALYQLADVLARLPVRSDAETAARMKDDGRMADRNEWELTHPEERNGR